jgi:hypothetical protein
MYKQFGSQPKKQQHIIKDIKVYSYHYSPTAEIRIQYLIHTQLGTCIGLQLLCVRMCMYAKLKDRPA